MTRVRSGEKATFQTQPWWERLASIFVSGIRTDNNHLRVTKLDPALASIQAVSEQIDAKFFAGNTLLFAFGSLYTTAVSTYNEGHNPSNYQQQIVAKVALT